MENRSVLEKIEDPHVENRYNMTSTSKQYPPPKFGGFVPNINDASTKDFAARPYSLYAKGEALFGNTHRQDLVGHLHKETPLNTVFFSQDNIDHIQQAVRDQVMLMSGNKYKIDKQNEDDIKIVMRSYYLMYNKNNPKMVAEELEDLNRRTIGYISGKVFSEVDFHMFYRKDIEQFATPIANPTNVHVYGSRSNELKSFF
jgi:hypothetical protein